MPLIDEKMYLLMGKSTYACIMNTRPWLHMIILLAFELYSQCWKFLRFRRDAGKNDAPWYIHALWNFDILLLLLFGICRHCDMNNNSFVIKIFKHFLYIIVRSHFVNQWEISQLIEYMLFPQLVHRLTCVVHKT